MSFLSEIMKAYAKIYREHQQRETVTKVETDRHEQYSVVHKYLDSDTFSIGFEIKQ